MRKPSKSNYLCNYYRYSGRRPSVGTAVWYGDSVGESTTTIAGPTGPTESQAPTTTTTPQPTTTIPPVSFSQLDPDYNS